MNAANAWVECRNRIATGERRTERNAVTAAGFARALLSGVMLSISCLLGLVGQSVAQVRTYDYSYFKERIPLRLDTERIALRADMDGASLMAALESHGITLTGIHRWLGHGWFVAGLTPDHQSEAGIMALLETVPAVLPGVAVSPVFSGGPERLLFPSTELLLRFDEDASDQDEQAILQAVPGVTGAEPNWARLSRTHSLRLNEPNGLEVLDLANVIATHPDVRFAQPYFYYSVTAAIVPNELPDPGLWALDGSDWDLNAPEAWQYTTGTPRIKVVVLDDGVQSAHPDLMVAEGADFTGLGGSGEPVEFCDNHGTQVAGCIATGIDNESGEEGMALGIAPACRIASAKVADSYFDFTEIECAWEASGTGPFVAGLDWAVSIGARVTNSSFTFQFPDPALTDKYAATRAAGLIHFAATGNDGAAQISYPSSLPVVNAVGAIDMSGILAQFDATHSSNHGPGIDYVAPGKAILTTDRTGGDGSLGGDYLLAQGTSFAAPYAAGVAALLLARNPFLTPSEVENILLNTAKNVGPAGYDTMFGWGVPDAHAAVIGAAPDGATYLIDVSTSGVVANSSSYSADVSDDGRYVVFESLATNVVPDDTNSATDVFVHDRLSGVTKRLSTDMLGTQGNGNSMEPSVSGAGVLVAFSSGASNLVPFDQNNVDDIFVRYLSLGNVVRVSVNSGGTEGNGSSVDPAVSGTGFVVFTSGASNLALGDANEASDVFRHSLGSGMTELVSVCTNGKSGDAGSFAADVSFDGRYVVFSSAATNLVSGDVNGQTDVFVRDMELGVTTLVSVWADGVTQGSSASYAPSISADGRYVVFESSSQFTGGSYSGNQVFRKDLLTGEVAVVSVSAAGLFGSSSTSAQVSGEGRYVAFSSIAAPWGWPGSSWRAYVKDMWAGDIELISKGSHGAPGGYGGDLRLRVSASGRYVVFQSNDAGSLVSPYVGGLHTYLHDRGVGESPWTDIGCALGGQMGEPRLAGSGSLSAGSTGTLDLTSAAPSAPSALFVSLASTPTYFKGGTLKAVPAVLQLPFLTDAAGQVLLTFTWPAGVPADTALYFQYIILDGSAVQGVALSNAIGAVTP